MRYNVNLSEGDRSRLALVLEDVMDGYKIDLDDEECAEEDRVWLTSELELTRRLLHQLNAVRGYEGAKVRMGFTQSNKDDGAKRQRILDDLARDLGGSVLWWDEMGDNDDVWHYETHYEFSADWEAEQFIESLDATKFYELGLVKAPRR